MVKNDYLSGFLRVPGLVSAKSLRGGLRLWRCVCRFAGGVGDAQFAQEFSGAGFGALLGEGAHVALAVGEPFVAGAGLVADAVAGDDAADVVCGQGQVHVHGVFEGEGVVFAVVEMPGDGFEGDGELCLRVAAAGGKVLRQLLVQGLAGLDGFEVVGHAFAHGFFQGVAAGRAFHALARQGAFRAGAVGAGDDAGDDFRGDFLSAGVDGEDFAGVGGQGVEDDGLLFGERDLFVVEGDGVRRGAGAEEEAEGEEVQGVFHMGVPGWEDLVLAIHGRSVNGFAMVG